MFDQEEADDKLFVNLPEAFNDYNDDGVYTPAGGGSCPTPISLATCSASGFEETFVDFNSNMAYDLNDDPAVYNGVLCPVEGDGVWCSRELVNVRDEIRILLTSSAAGAFKFVLKQGSTIRTTASEGSNYTVSISDQWDNPPGGGDIVSVKGNGDCSIITETSFTAPDTNSPGPFVIPLAVEGNGNEVDDKLVTTGSVTVTVITKQGGESSRDFSCATKG